MIALPLVVDEEFDRRRNSERENVSLPRPNWNWRLNEVRRARTSSLSESLVCVQQAAATDPLTGLYNRRHFGKVIDQLFSEAQRYNNDLSCVMIDLDGYKQLNDSFGHQVGDQLLVVAAKSIANNLRADGHRRPIWR